MKTTKEPQAWDTALRARQRSRARSRTGLLALALGVASATECSREVAPAPRQSLGNVMTEVARRFEVAGRASLAQRYELAEFEAGEIEELFESDVPGAELPKEGPTAHIPTMAKAFLETNTKELRRAAASKDPASFDLAFRHTAAACNACHAASAKGFIEVPAVAGKPVPNLDPPSNVPAKLPPNAPTHETVDSLAH